MYRQKTSEILQERHAEPFQVLQRLADLGEAFLVGVDVGANEPNKLIPICLLVRQISALRALGLLAASGFYTEALGHQRCLMEALARIAALAEKPELLDDYLAQDLLNRKRLIEDIRSFRGDWPDDLKRDPSDDELLDQLETIQTSLDEFRERSGRVAREVKTFNWAQIGKVEQLLFGHFVIASEALHFSPKSLERLLVTKDKHLSGIRIGPEGEDLDHLLLTSCKYVFVGIERLAHILGIDVPGDIEDLYRNYETIFERRAEAAIGARISGDS